MHEESSTFACIAAMGQLRWGNLKEHQKTVHLGVKYLCKDFRYEPTTNVSQCTDVSSTITNIAAKKQVQ